MNAPVQIPGPIRKTQAAEGLPRRAFTVAEVERMTQAGVLDEDDRLELIGGELVVMPAKGIRHEILKAALNEHWLGRRPADLRIVPETTFRLSEDTLLEPDFLVFRDPVKLREVSGQNVLLAVEIADASLGYDLYRKPLVYARFGVREMWVIDAVRRETHVFLQPGDAGYARLTVHASSELLVPSFAADLPLRLEDLTLDWE